MAFDKRATDNEDFLRQVRRCIDAARALTDEEARRAWCEEAAALLKAAEAKPRG